MRTRRQALSFRNGEVREDLAGEYEKVVKKIKDFYCFYVITPTICKEFHYIKIGKSSSAANRMRDYAKVLQNEFEILHFRVFRKTDKEREGVHNFFAAFETAVKRKLKEIGVESLEYGSEFYDKKDLKKIMEAIGLVEDENIAKKMEPMERAKVRNEGIPKDMEKPKAKLRSLNRMSK